MNQEELKSLLEYNPENGIFTRKINRKGYKCKKGTIVGHLTKHGYLNFTYKSKQYYLHRLAFLYMEGYLPENFVDHINRNKTDNRWCNLREVSQSCNVRNSKVFITNNSGVTGVSYEKRTNTFVALIHNKNKPIILGRFREFKDAVIARWNGEKLYEYPNCNSTSSAYNWLKCNGVDISNVDMPKTIAISKKDIFLSNCKITYSYKEKGLTNEQIGILLGIGVRQVSKRISIIKNGKNYENR